MKKDLENIPKDPGCYLFKDSNGKVIYVGKAKNLNKRVRSYFQKTDHDVKTQALVLNISSFEFFVTDSEVEAFILENSLIKKHKPKYNILLKDSRRYAYIQVTNESYPRLLVVRNREGEGKFYGPFVSGQSRDHVVNALGRIFKIRTCKKLPKRECIRYSIGLCSAPCTNKISREGYLEDVRAAEFVLKGRTKELVKILTSNMQQASKRLNFERALEFKNQIMAVKALDERQKVERSIKYDEDFINYLIRDNLVYLIVFNSRNGILENKIDFELENFFGFLEDFLLQYYSENGVPKRVVVPEKVDPFLEEFLSRLKGSKVEVLVPKKGEAKKLLELVKKNIEVKVFADEEKVSDLAKRLNLNEVPEVIECFDISHLSGTLTVASMIQFRMGKPDKSNYRRYKINTVDGIDDFASMKEVIRRRYSKLKNESLDLPNLILIDGGKGQLNRSLEVLEELGLKIPIISLAKREEEVFLPGKSEPVILPKKSSALKLIQNARDEAHRFAINYNRLRRSKKMFEE